MILNLRMLQIKKYESQQKIMKIDIDDRPKIYNLATNHRLFLLGSCCISALLCD